MDELATCASGVASVDASGVVTVGSLRVATVDTSSLVSVHASGSATNGTSDVITKGAVLATCLSDTADPVHLCVHLSCSWSHRNIRPHSLQLGAPFMFTSCVSGSISELWLLTLIGCCGTDSEGSFSSLFRKAWVGLQCIRIKGNSNSWLRTQKGA